MKRFKEYISEVHYKDLFNARFDALRKKYLKIRRENSQETEWMYVNFNDDESIKNRGYEINNTKDLMKHLVKRYPEQAAEIKKMYTDSLKKIKEAFELDYEFRHEPWGLVDTEGKIIDGSKREWTREQMRNGRHEALARYLGLGGIRKAVENGYIRWGFGESRARVGFFEFSIANYKKLVLKNMEDFINAKRSELQKMNEFFFDVHTKTGRRDSLDQTLHSLLQVRDFIESLKHEQNKDVDSHASI